MNGNRWREWVVKVIDKHIQKSHQTLNTDKYLGWKAGAKSFLKTEVGDDVAEKFYNLCGEQPFSNRSSSEVLATTEKQSGKRRVWIGFVSRHEYFKYLQ